MHPEVDMTNGTVGRPDLDQRFAAVVLSGGTSRRFGRDKLTEPVGGRDLLAAAIEDLPVGTDVILVGPDGSGRAGVRTVREEPVGGGPAAGLVCGLQAALADAEVAMIVTLPGDAPLAGTAARRLAGRLRRDPAAAAVIGVDPDAREQPLQLALRRTAAEALVAAAGSTGGAGASVRALVGAALSDTLVRQPLGFAETFDIDTPGQLTAWLVRDSEPVHRVRAAVDGLRRKVNRPVVVALDGPSGAGKSILATALQLVIQAGVVAGDDFYSQRLGASTPSAYAGWSDADLVDAIFDWARLRSVIEPLAAGQPVVYRPYDWGAGDGRLGREVHREPQPVIIVEGVYAARPELADLVDLRVLVEVGASERIARLASRGDDPAWAGLWERAEQHYFSQIRTPADFDLRVRSDLSSGLS